MSNKKKKKQRRKLNIPRIVMLGTGAALLIAIGVLALILLAAKNDLVDQNIADRWSEDNDYAHNSIFFSTREAIDEKKIGHLRSEIVKGMEKKSIVVSFDDTDEMEENMMDAYAAFGTLTISSDIRKEKTYDAIGVGGDFFRFHPVYLKTGNYFDDDNIMQDYVLLDEEAAWELFGGLDVAGMRVHVGGRDLYVAGVYERAQSEIDNLAQGNEEPKVFVSYAVMKEVGNDTAITVYELLSPNPIPHAAYNVLKDVKLFSADNVKYIENSDRFSYPHYYELLKSRKGREMRTDDIRYPYWENVARYKEGKNMYVAFWQWNLAGVLALMIIVNVIWFIVDHKPNKKSFEKIVDSVREKRRKKRYEEQRQKLIEEEFGPDPMVEDEPIVDIKKVGEGKPEGASDNSNDAVANNEPEHSEEDAMEAAVVGATMKMIEGEKTPETKEEEISEDSVDLRLKEVKKEDEITEENKSEDKAEETVKEETNKDLAAEEANAEEKPDEE